MQTPWKLSIFSDALNIIHFEYNTLIWRVIPTLFSCAYFDAQSLKIRLIFAADWIYCKKTNLAWINDILVKDNNRNFHEEKRSAKKRAWFD